MGALISVAAGTAAAIVLSVASPTTAVRDSTVAEDLTAALATQEAEVAIGPGNLSIEEGAITAPTATSAEFELTLPGTPGNPETEGGMVMGTTHDRGYSTAVQDAGGGAEDQRRVD